MRISKMTQRGAMLIMALGLIGVLWFLVLGFAHSAVRTLRLSQRAIAGERAQWAAESGMRLTLQAMAKDAKYQPQSAAVKMAHSTESYKIQRFEEGKSPVKIPTGTVYLLATGYDRTGVERKLAVVVKLGSEAKSVLNFSVFAESLEVNGGSSIDSFDSKVGLWQRGSKANVATNSVKKGSIELSGGSWIQGTIQVGPGGRTGEDRPLRPTTKTDNVVWKDWSCWSLAESAMDSPLEFPPVQLPEAGKEDVKVDWKGLDLKPGAYSDLEASGGGEVRLTGGTYVFRTLKLNGGAKLTFKGDTPATIYVTKDLDFSNGTLNNLSGQPKNLVFMMGRKVTARLNGGAQVLGVFYGPEADIELNGGTDLYGAVVAEKVTLKGGAKIHYDVDLIKNPPSVLSTSSSGSGGASVVSWQKF